MSTYRSNLGCAAAAIALTFGILSGSALAQSRPATPVEANGKLQVISTKLCNARGEPVQLRGAALHGLQWSGWFYQNPASIRAAARDWGIDVLRISVYVYEGGYLNNPKLTPADFDAMIEGYIATCVETGIYCILDWHVHHPGYPSYYTKDAKVFFEKYSRKYGHLPNLIYEIANEPNKSGLGDSIPGRPVTWDSIAVYAKEVIPVIRANAPDAVVLVGTPGWSQLGHADGYRWQDIRDRKLAFNNILYVIHFYCDGHSENYLQFITAAAVDLPLFATEWSPGHYSLEKPFNSSKAKPWVDMMNRFQISSAYWLWGAGKNLWDTFDSTTKADGPFSPTGANVTASGKYMYDWLNNPPDKWSNQVVEVLHRPEGEGSRRKHIPYITPAMLYQGEVRQMDGRVPESSRWLGKGSGTAWKEECRPLPPALEPAPGPGVGRESAEST